MLQQLKTEMFTPSDASFHGNITGRLTLEKFPRIEALTTRWDAACIASISQQGGLTQPGCIVASMPCWVTNGGIPWQPHYIGQACRTMATSLRWTGMPNHGNFTALDRHGESWHLQHIARHLCSKSAGPGDPVLEQDVLGIRHNH